MAIVGGTARPENKDIKAIACAMPELGPSLGIAPLGQCTWMLRSFMRLTDGSCTRPSSNACAFTHYLESVVYAVKSSICIRKGYWCLKRIPTYSEGNLDALFENVLQISSQLNSAVAREVLDFNKQDAAIAA